MKRTAYLLTMVCLLLTACGTKTEITPADPQTTVLSAVQPTETDAPADTTASGVKQDNEDPLRLTGEDIYLCHSSFDYIPQWNDSARFVIRSEEELNRFNALYGMELEVPYELPENNDDVIYPYDLAHYDLVLEYQGFSHGGYDLRPDALLVGRDTLEFSLSPESVFPEAGDTVTEAFEGVLFEAAVPKGTLLNDAYEGWTYITADAEDVTETGSGETLDIGENYAKPFVQEDIVTDPETGIQYVRNQLLISCQIGTDRAEVEKLVESVQADIVGYIELTSDYQIEFREEQGPEQLQVLADQIGSYPFVMNVTLNLVTPTAIDDGCPE